MKIQLLSIVLLFSTLIHGQTTKPKIGSDTAIKENFIKIKNGLPDIKNNLVEKRSDTYLPKISLGNAGSYKDDKGDQTLSFTYSTDGYSGTDEDFQNYYKTLVSLAKEVFGDVYAPSSNQVGNIRRTMFFEPGKDYYTSPTIIYFKCDPNSYIKITVEIIRKGR